MTVIQQPCTGVGVCFLGGKGKEGQDTVAAVRCASNDSAALNLRLEEGSLGNTIRSQVPAHTTCTTGALHTSWTHAPHDATALSVAEEGRPGLDFSLHHASSITGFWSLLFLCGQLPLTHLACELLPEREHGVELCLWHPLAPTQRKHSSHFTATYGR